MPEDTPAQQKARLEMVKYQIESRGIHQERLLEALRAVPRHWFIPEESRYMAYEDHPAPIGLGQTISQPYIVALMISLLKLQGHERVLEIGCGSGYQAALLGLLAGEVHTIELRPELAAAARANLAHFDLPNVQVHEGDGSAGMPGHAPFDGILVSAAAPEVPPPLRHQLTPLGRLVLPVGPRHNQHLQVWQHTPDGFECVYTLPVMFVPLRGHWGWPNDVS
ncbi:MAG TPA: protein-L-isoaspartate(D-aspartate) O-methyltransferase [Anaerolineaceae bacterium]|nr:protein-L-isoaspartate(D-aspartate) O-methyltransferase [Anaerolineaceae bacterium]HPN52045.1 protein-L-isoaspartate(D-aspartate) O-methyltransferase [Anaerolineaceae bacterium]